MTVETRPQPAAPPGVDEARLAGLVAQVMAADRPAKALEDTLTALDVEQQLALAAALYEAVCYRVPVHEYWLHFRMSRVYDALGPARDDAAFFHAAAAVQMQPDWPGADAAFRAMFLSLVRRGRDREALDLFRHQMQYAPERPAASADEIAPIVRRLDPAAADAAARPPAPRGACRLHPATEQATRPPWTCPTFGAGFPYSLRLLGEPMVRPAITVAEFSDAEVLIYHDAVVVLDQFGDMHEAFSVSDFSAEIRATFARREASGMAVPLHEVEEAVLISDRHPQANICHFLLNQISRLALYQGQGVDTAHALVIGPDARLPAQGEILRRAGVAAYLGTGRVARVRARRLWVSSNCRDVRHAAHYGADWAVGFLQQTLGGRGTKGWRRLYLSRADAGARRVTNETEVMALLEPHGFEAIVPGRMDYAAQIAAFRHASDVIAPHGAALTHMVLCPPSARVLEIFHPLYGTPAYAMQAPAAGLDYAAMVARDWESDAPEWNDPTLVDVSPTTFLARHMRVDLDALARYLATLV